jgi:hypothetical protein
MEPRLPSSWLGAVLPSVTCAPIGPLRQASIIAAICSGARQSPAPRRWRPIGFVPRRAAPGSPRCASSKAGNRHLAPGRDPEPENSLLRGDRGFESTSLQRRVIGRRWIVAGVPQNHQVVSFKSPADTPAMPGMLRKSTAFVPRYQKFESISLQRRVYCEPEAGWYADERRGGRSVVGYWKLIQDHSGASGLDAVAMKSRLCMGVNQVRTRTSRCRQSAV